MASFTGAISDLVNSLVAFISGIFNAIFAAIESVFSAIRALITSIVELLGGVVGFILGNIMVLAVIAAAVGVYMVFLRRSGEKIVVQKKKI